MIPRIMRDWSVNIIRVLNPIEWSGPKANFFAGPKIVNQKAGIWHDHNEEYNRPREIYMDDSNYAEGFTYECCGGQGDDGGCEGGNHILEDGQVRTLPTSNKRKAEDEISRPATYARLF